jgi:hypothetical protein
VDDPQRLQFEELTRQLVALAQRFLAELGSFQPFGGCIRRDGEFVHLGVDPAVDDYERTVEAIAHRIRELDTDCGIIVTDVQFKVPGSSERSDAIMLAGEIRAGVVMRSFLPYSRSDDGALTYGAAVFDPKPPRVVFEG